MKLDKKTKKIIRHKRIKAKIIGTKEAPRLCVFRSNKHIYAQLINDEKGEVIISSKDVDIKKKIKKIELAFEVGKLIAQKAVEKKIGKIVFDRAGYKYHGRVKSLADGARQGGLKF
jgi:large subunit ribosomal protein L18